jgi:NAD(P)-dependent dehydrogenase (short-subunit alcohol dehydrogenase family)
MTGLAPQRQGRQTGHESPMVPAPDFVPRFDGSGRSAGTVALITGGYSGIGCATSVLFAREGARVAILYKDGHKDAGRTLDLIREEGSDGMALACDMGQKAQVEAAVREVIGRFGRIGVLAKNATERHVQDRPEDIGKEQLKRPSIPVSPAFSMSRIACWRQSGRVMRSGPSP